jgi:S-adenosyl-L-methionine hydrolase (adenosine-forming)
MTVISLLTDFGSQDGFVGVMKGVIWGISANVQIADISHEIYPQNILHGALILGQSWKYFPEGSIHVAIVDPGVGTQRHAIAARVGKHFFVAPDNGLITIAWAEAIAQGELTQVVVLDRQQFWLPHISRSFHGRDIFAPVAAHLANGVSLDELGTAIDTPMTLPIPQPYRRQLVGVRK